MKTTKRTATAANVPTLSERYGLYGLTAEQRKAEQAQRRQAMQGAERSNYSEYLKKYVPTPNSAEPTNLAPLYPMTADERAAYVAFWNSQYYGLEDVATYARNSYLACKKDDKKAMDTFNSWAEDITQEMHLALWEYRLEKGLEDIPYLRPIPDSEKGVCLQALKAFIDRMSPKAVKVKPIAQRKDIHYDNAEQRQQALNFVGAVVGLDKEQKKIIREADTVKLENGYVAEFTPTLTAEDVNKKILKNGIFYLNSEQAKIIRYTACICDSLHTLTETADKIGISRQTYTAKLSAIQQKLTAKIQTAERPTAQQLAEQARQARQEAQKTAEQSAQFVPLYPMTEAEKTAYVNYWEKAIAERQIRQARRTAQQEAQRTAQQAEQAEQARQTARQAEQARQEADIIRQAQAEQARQTARQVYIDFWNAHIWEKEATNLVPLYPMTELEKEAYTDFWKKNSYVADTAERTTAKQRTARAKAYYAEQERRQEQIRQALQALTANKIR